MINRYVFVENNKLITRNNSVYIVEYDASISEATVQSFTTHLVLKLNSNETFQPNKNYRYDANANPRFIIINLIKAYRKTDGIMFTLDFLIDGFVTTQPNPPSGQIVLGYDDQLNQWIYGPPSQQQALPPPPSDYTISRFQLYKQLGKASYDVVEAALGTATYDFLVRWRSGTRLKVPSPFSIELGTILQKTPSEIFLIFQNAHALEEDS